MFNKEMRSMKRAQRKMLNVWEYDIGMPIMHTYMLYLCIM